MDIELHCPRCKKPTRLVHGCGWCGLPRTVFNKEDEWPEERLDLKNAADSTSKPGEDDSPSG